MRSSFRVLATAVAACGLSAPFAWAGSYTTISGVSGSWDDTNLWSPLGSPGAGDSATISNASVGVFQQTSVAQVNLSNSFLEINGNNTYGDVGLTVSGQVSNNGTIKLQDFGGGFFSTLSATGGIINSNTIQLVQGNGGPRQINADIVNNYDVDDTGSTTYLNGNFTNNNLYYRHGGGTTNFAAGYTINQNANQFYIASDSTFNVNGSTFNYNGGSVVGTINLYGGSDSSNNYDYPHLNMAVTNGQNATFNFYFSGGIGTDIPASTNVNIFGNSTYGGLTIALPSAVTNNGTLTLTDAGGGYDTTIGMGSTGTGTLTNNNVLNLSSSLGGSRTVQGNIINNYIVNDNAVNTYIYGGVTNANLYQRGPNGHTYIEAGNTFVQQSWKLVIDPTSTFEVDGSTFDYAGGTVIGTVDLNYGYDQSSNFYYPVLKTSVSDGQNATFNFHYAGYLDTDLPQHTTLNVQPNGTVGAVTLYVPQIFTNGGTINVNSQGGGYTGTLWAGDGTGTITNNGTINFNTSGAGGPREFAGNVVNNFAIYDNGQDTYLYGNITNNNLYQRGAGGATYVPAGYAFNQNAWQLIIDPQSHFEVDGGSFNYNGGTMSGVITMSYGYTQNNTFYYPVLNTNVSDGHGAGFIFIYNGFLNTNLAQNTKVDVVANGTVGAVTLWVKDGQTNNGTISLYSAGGGFTSVLGVVNPNDNTLTGTYHIGTTGNLVATDFNLVGGTREVDGNLINQGNILVADHLDVFGYVDNKFLGLVSIAPHTSLEIHGSNDFTLDGGTLEIEAGAALEFPDGGHYIFKSGQLNVAGKFVVPSQPALGQGDAIVVSNKGVYGVLSGDLVLAAAQIVSGGGGNVVGVNGASLIGQDGSGLIGQDGSGLIAINEADLIGQDGSGLIGQDGSGLIQNSISAFRPAAKLAGVGAPPSAATPPTASIIADDSSITLSNGYALADGWGVLRNNGLLTGNGTFTASTFDIDSTSSVFATGGTLHMLGPINQYSAGTLTQGTWVVQDNSALDTPSMGAITINQANVELDGPGSVWTNIDSLADNQGSFTITIGRNFTTAGAFNNSGTLTAGPGSTFTSTTSFTQATGSSVFDTLVNNGSFNHSGGSLSAATILNNGSMTAASASLGNVSGTGSLTISPGAVAVANSLKQNALTVNGALAITSHSSAKPVVLNSISLGASGVLDLANNPMIVKYTGNSPAAGIRAALASAYNGGTWTGNGITSSTAAADAGHNTALAYVEASDLGLDHGGSFAGETIANQAVLVKYTYYGDENLDGKVNLDDFSIFLDGINGLGSGWVYGDFNYDGVIDQKDFSLFVSGFNLNGQPLSQLRNVILSDLSLSASQKSALLSTVPEPTSAAAVALLPLLLFRRRKSAIISAH